MRFIWLLLCPVLLLSACRGEATSPEDVLEETAALLAEAVPAPGVGSTGGEWLILGLVRSGAPVPEGMGDAYLDALETRLLETEGRLSDTLYTEYARAVLALTALGEDPADVAGYDLIAPLCETEAVAAQGVNGPVYALLALDSGEYAVAEGVREAHIAEILAQTLPGGGYALTGESADPDVTAMAALALGPYRGDPEVEGAVEAAVSALAAAQLEDGGYASAMGETADTVAVVIWALCDLGIGVEDSRFVRGDKTLMDKLLEYHLDGGGFTHGPGEETMNLMTTEQALLALAAHARFVASQPGLVHMAS